MKASRILAVDPGSIACAVVMFNGERPVWAGVAEAKQKNEWHTRLSTMAADLEEILEDVAAPDLIAIEKVVAHMNLGVAITMAMTVGYLTRVLQVRYPLAFWVEVPKASVCHAVGIKGNARRKERQEAAKAKFKWVSQDACDAGAVGLAAFRMLDESA